MTDKKIGICDSCGYEKVELTLDPAAGSKFGIGKWFCEVCASTYISAVMYDRHHKLYGRSEIFQTIGYATNMILERLTKIEQCLECPRAPKAMGKT